MLAGSSSTLLLFSLLFVFFSNFGTVYGVSPTVLTYPGVCGALFQYGTSGGTIDGVLFDFKPLVEATGGDYTVTSITNAPGVTLDFNICNATVNPYSYCSAGTASCLSQTSSYVPTTYATNTVTYGFAAGYPTITYQSPTADCSGSYSHTTITLVCNQTATTPVVTSVGFTSPCVATATLQASYACPVGFSNGSCTTYQNGEFYNFNPLTVSSGGLSYVGYSGSPNYEALFFNICGNLVGANVPSSCTGTSACAYSYGPAGSASPYSITSINYNTGSNIITVPQINYNVGGFPFNCGSGTTTFTTVITMVCNPQYLLAPSITATVTTSCQVDVIFQSAFACPNPLLHLPASPYVLPKFNTTMEFLGAGVSSVSISFMGLPFQHCRLVGGNTVSGGGVSFIPQRISCPAPQNPQLAGFVGVYTLRFGLTTTLQAGFPTPTTYSGYYSFGSV